MPFALPIEAFDLQILQILKAFADESSEFIAERPWPDADGISQELAQIAPEVTLLCLDSVIGIAFNAIMLKNTRHGSFSTPCRKFSTLCGNCHPRNHGLQLQGLPEKEQPAHGPCCPPEPGCNALTLQEAAYRIFP